MFSHNWSYLLILSDLWTEPSRSRPDRPTYKNFPAEGLLWLTSAYLALFWLTFGKVGARNEWDAFARAIYEIRPEFEITSPKRSEG
jgi:hypothetical protein